MIPGQRKSWRPVFCQQLMQLLLLLPSAVAVAGETALEQAGGEEAVRRQERLREGDRYHVRMTVEISGTLRPPAAKGKTPPRPVKMEGSSTIDYHERVLTLEKGQVRKTLRYCEKLDFKRTVAG